MRRRDFALAALSIIGLVLLGPADADARHQDRDRICDYHPARGPWHRHRLARCFFDVIRPPGTWASTHSTMDCETRGAGRRSATHHWDPAPADWRTRLGHSGPLQQAHPYWPGRFHHYERRWDDGLVNNPGHYRTNIVISYRMARAKGSWRPDWRACA